MRHLGFLKGGEPTLIGGGTIGSDLGLVLLMLADRWRCHDDGGRVSAAARFALGELRGRAASDQHPALESGFVALVDSSGRATADAFSRAALGYAESLFRSGLWEAGRDVCDFVLMIPAANRSPDVTIRAHLRRAYAHRSMCDLDASEADYRAALFISRRTPDPVSDLRARLGLAILTYRRGNLPAAETALRRIIRSARRAGVAELIARAHHDLGAVLGERGRISESLEAFGEALRIEDYPDREVLIGDCALTLALAGHPDLARQLFHMLVHASSSSVAVACARINLIILASWEGNRAEIEHHEGALERTGLPPFLEIDFFLALGRARSKLGDVGAAERALAKAARLASEWSFGQRLIDADAAMERLCETGRVKHAANQWQAEQAERFVRAAELVLEGRQ